ncbi:MAG: hypothetical protein ACJA2X_000965 [Halocynthiibacter sp.]|jgi:hypothetical protein
MIDLIHLPKFGAAETIELSRMLLARKLMPQDRRGTLSPMVNAILAQCVLLHAPIPVALAAWLPRLKDQFIQELSDADADPSLSRFLEGLENDAARESTIRQYFLPYPAVQDFEASSPQSIVETFSATVNFPYFTFDMGPLYPTMPADGLIVLPRPFANSIFDQILIGRHSHIHLELLRSGGTNKAASDAVIHTFIDALKASSGSGLELQPFHSHQLRHSDFAQSFAYTQMMELGMSHEEMVAALSPWTLVN